MGRLTFYSARASFFVYHNFCFLKGRSAAGMYRAFSCWVTNLCLDIAFGAAPRMSVVMRVRALSKGCCCKVVACWLRWVPLVARPGARL